MSTTYARHLAEQYAIEGHAITREQRRDIMRAIRRDGYGHVATRTDYDTGRYVLTFQRARRIVWDIERWDGLTGATGACNSDRLAERIVAHYRHTRFTPGGPSPIEAVERWLRVNGYMS